MSNRPANTTKNLYPENARLSNKNLEIFFDSYFRDIPHSLMRKATEETATFVEKNMSLVKWMPDRWGVLDEAIKSVTVKNGIWIELGIYSGQTVNFIAERSGGNNIYGLDSFEGLPETWRADFTKGMFSSQTLPKVKKNVVVIKGLFDNTLPKILEKDQRNVSFLHIDCDLYSSTKKAFDLLRRRIIPGTVFVFDEFFNYPGWKLHEYRAFNELIMEDKIKYQYLCYARAHSQVALQII